MAWIESHQELGRHPKTIRLAKTLGINVPQAVGHLHFLWWWALDYAQDGDLYDFDNDEIAYALQWDGEPEFLIEALIKAHFLDKVDGRLYIHDFDDYVGKLLDKREKNKERSRKAREKSVLNANATHTAVEGSPPVENSERATNAYAVRDERATNIATVHNTTVPTQPTEQNTTNTTTANATHTAVEGSPPVGGGVSDLDSVSENFGRTPKNSEQQPNIQEQRFNEFWNVYPKKQAKQDALKAWKKLKPNETLFAHIIEAVKAQVRSADWLKENGRFIPHPATWLNAGRWDDVVQPPTQGIARAAPYPQNQSPPLAFKPSTGGRSFDDYRNDNGT